MKGVSHPPPATVPRAAPLILLVLSAGVGLIDWLWARSAGFAVAGQAYAGIVLLSALLWAGGYFYAARREPGLAAMLFGTAFLAGFTAGASILNAMLLTVAGPRVDAALARVDIWMGLDWPGMMRMLANHPGLLKLLRPAYESLLPQIALAVIVLGGLGRDRSLYRFVLAVAIGALICIFIWTLFPAFGAMSVYDLDPATAARLSVTVDGAYGQALVRMLHDGPGMIAPDNVKGLIGFPSYHAVLALLLIWHLSDVPWLRWPALAVNGMVVFSTPIEGGHHWVDVFAALPVTAVAIALAGRLLATAARLDIASAAASLRKDAVAPTA